MANPILSRLHVKLIIILAMVVICGVGLYQKLPPLGMDLRGGSELHYRIKTENLTEEEKQESTGRLTRQTIEVIRKRLDPTGSLEMTIRQRSAGNFYIQLPGLSAERAARMETLIRRAGKLLFCLTSMDEDQRKDAAEGIPVAGYSPFVAERDSETKKQTGRYKLTTYPELKEALDVDPTTAWLLVESIPSVTGEYLADAYPTTDGSQRPAVGFRFRGPGRTQFAQVTDRHKRVGEKPGAHLAIVLDEILYSAPEIMSRIEGDGIIQGSFTAPEVDDLVSTLRAGSLPVDIELEWKNTVGPKLGEDSIRAGMLSAIIGLIIVVLLMAGYYFLTGIIADFAVLLNLLLVLGVMALFDFTLTLPGIAGLTLSLAMAVDANVLINERIREETALGKSLRLAIKSGYSRAFVTILDSNLTTLIAAVILYLVGKGPVQGFALTLGLGIVISMFTAIWVTRAIIDWLVETGMVVRLHMMQAFKLTSFRFMNYSRVFLALSVVAIVVGLSIFISRLHSQKILDTDFVSGARIEMELRKSLPIAQVRQRIAKLFSEPDVQSVLAPGQGFTTAEGATTRFTIRLKGLSPEQKVEKMLNDLAALQAGNDLAGNVSIAPGTEPGDRTFLLKLSRKVSEEQMRRMIVDAGYPESAIEEVQDLNLKAGVYLIRLRPNAQGRSDAAIRAILPEFIGQGKQATITTVDVKDVEVGQVQKEPAEEGRESAEFIPLRLREPFSPAAVREGLLRAVPDLNVERLRVAGHGADSGKDRCRELAVYGTAKDLDRIRQNVKDLRLFDFTLTGNEEMYITFEADVPEPVVLSQLSKQRAQYVAAVLPQRAQSDDYTVQFQELRPEKELEAIRERLTAEFKAELSASRIIAQVAPSAPPEGIKNLEKLQNEGYRFFKLTVARSDGDASQEPVRLQEVISTLDVIAKQDALARSEPVTSTEAEKPAGEVPLMFKGSEAEIAQTTQELVTAFANPSPFRKVEQIGKAVSQEMVSAAILAVILSWVFMNFYLWFRFGEVKFGMGGVVSLIHDVCVTLGAVGIADALSGTPIGNVLGFRNIKVSQEMVAAFLTLVGYSINDTIVVFDRIRENMGGVRRNVDAALVDASINQTLSRTMLTGVTTAIVLLVLYLFGGPTIHGFAFVMLFGIIVGTYSSIFVACPVVLGWGTFWTKLGGIFGGSRKSVLPAKGK